MDSGGALYFYYYCITIGQYSEVMFVSNSAMQCGGAMYCDRHSDVTIEGPVTFTSTVIVLNMVEIFVCHSLS